jgi:hypothetical protein
MEYLLLEQIQANKRITKNIKFNKGCELAKACADNLSDMIRGGIQNDVIKVLLESEKHKVVEINRRGCSEITSCSYRGGRGKPKNDLA